MLRPVPILPIVLLSLTLWGLATAYIHLWPDAFTDPVLGAAGFVAALPMAWLSVWLVRRIAGDRLLPAVSLVGAIAMMLDGLALRFWPGVYGTDATLLQLGAAWLLWGYGVSLAMALLWSAMMERARA